MAQKNKVRIGDVWQDARGRQLEVIGPMNAQGKIALRNMQTGRPIASKGPRALVTMVRQGHGEKITKNAAPSARPRAAKRTGPRQLTPAQIAAGFGGGGGPRAPRAARPARAPNRPKRPSGVPPQQHLTRHPTQGGVRAPRTAPRGEVRRNPTGWHNPDVAAFKQVAEAVNRDPRVSSVKTDEYGYDKFDQWFEEYHVVMKSGEQFIVRMGPWPERRKPEPNPTTPAAGLRTSAANPYARPMAMPAMANPVDFDADYDLGFDEPFANPPPASFGPPSVSFAPPHMSPMGPPTGAPPHMGPPPAGYPGQYGHPGLGMIPEPEHGHSHVGYPGQYGVPGYPYGG